MELVSVMYGFEYTTRDGRLVSIQPKESYILLCKTNEHWWHVRKDVHTRPIYVPAQYVRELGAGGDLPQAPVTQTGPPDLQTGFTDNLPDGKRCQTPTHPHTLDCLEMQSSTGCVPFAAAAPSHLHMEMSGDAPLRSEITAPTLIAPEEETAPQDQDFPPPPSPVCDVTPSDLHPSESSAEKAENENVHSAVYVNVGQLRRSVSECPPTAPSSCSPSNLNAEGWEVHVDQESGQEYYYHPETGRSTWERPARHSPADLEARFFPSAIPLSPSSPSAWTSAWEKAVDESSGRPYFYNTMSGESSWELPKPPSPYLLSETMHVPRIPEDGPPPLPEEDYPSEHYPCSEPPPPEPFEDVVATGHQSLPKDLTFSNMGRTTIPRATLDRTVPTGWNLNVEPNGIWVFSTENSPDQWIKSVDERGQTYYYQRNGSRSQWTLPEVPVGPNLPKEENGVESDNPSVITNWRHSMGPLQLSNTQDDGRFMPTHRRNTSDYSSDSSSTGNSPESQQNVFKPWRKPYYRTSRWLRKNVQNLEKAGILNKTKVSENGKKVRKNWTQTWSVLHGGVLTFHKDPKSATTGASGKTNQIVAEVAVDLRGATIGWAPKDKSSKKNVLELKGKNGVEFLIQYDTESIINDWHKVLVDTIRQLEHQDHHSEDEDAEYEKIGSLERDERPGASMDRRRPYRPSVSSTTSTPPSTADTDPKKVRTKLMKFLMKRPTLQSVKEKGYIRDNVFGCHLATLCAFEKTTVPSFVEKCIRAVERRGLDIDGLYRVSGNLAVIQKLRFKADHEELDLEDGQWEDVHVLTGALKLFFRELSEPLFPFSHFHEFIKAVRIAEYNTKLSHFYELVRNLPPPNHDTMKLLFGHLHRVIEFGEDNRMTVQNVAIVFGPTLLRPETESNNIAMHMVFQNQIVEFILNEYERIFN